MMDEHTDAMVSIQKETHSGSTDPLAPLPSCGTGEAVAVSVVSTAAVSLIVTAVSSSAAANCAEPATCTTVSNSSLTNVGTALSASVAAVSPAPAGCCGDGSSDGAGVAVTSGVADAAGSTAAACGAAAAPRGAPAQQQGGNHKTLPPVRALLLVLLPCNYCPCCSP